MYIDFLCLTESNNEKTIQNSTGKKTFFKYDKKHIHVYFM